MYTHYFGLNDKPFAIAPNPRYLYMSELHREALAHLIYGIQRDGCFILLTGDVGTGKTTVCRCLLEQLPEDTDVAIILNPKLTAIDLLKTICEELSIPVPSESPTGKSYIDALNRHLLQTHAEGRSTALVIDEAQNLEADVLEQLRLLTNLETDTQKLLKIILLGQPELRTLLAGPQMSQVNQRITSRYHLQPLQPEDVRIYIQHRLRVAGGGTRRLFTDPAIKHVARISKGIPRLINLICDRALLGAYAENADRVNWKIMRKAGREVLEDGRPSFFSRRFVLITVITLAILGIGMPAAWHYLKTPALETFIKQWQPLKNSTPEANEPTTGQMSHDASNAATDDRQSIPKTDQDTKQQPSSVFIDQTVSKMETNPDKEAVQKK
ncbi:AAA family ATPase [Desulfoprunum benzoelyticum]|uniref:General secretion pathway protein A n=1 Tax=Desulfoprunum benzoelyticum TaxID=1506996 RepID=A0A840USK4_9BACT|nr:AAA family ATPase [Desulfoprunum benzoelyticum]MBB5347816.1 general secretion pathway protein A [Desulfoprunum benzoelyticum]MBM9530681.1 AAA family ATPase [Desulfoprunum benzoelyticum]